jgi:hypothetical protein
MGKGFEAGGAVFGFIHFARAEAVQQRAQDAPHVGVVVDHEEAQAVEVDADHEAPTAGAAAPVAHRGR